MGILQASLKNTKFDDKSLIIMIFLNFYKNKFPEFMPKRFIRFNLFADESKKSLFLKDPKTDFLVVL